MQHGLGLDAASRGSWAVSAGHIDAGTGTPHTGGDGRGARAYVATSTAVGSIRGEPGNWVAVGGAFANACVTVGVGGADDITLAAVIIVRTEASGSRRR